MIDPASVALKFAFLAVLYLFLLWISRNALKDLRRTTLQTTAAPYAPPQDATGIHSASTQGQVAQDLDPRLVVERTVTSPGTMFTASSIGLVIVTCICSTGITPLSTPITTRGKFVVGKTEMGIWVAR